MGHQIYSASSHFEPWGNMRTAVRAVAYGCDLPGPLRHRRLATGTEFACHT